MFCSQVATLASLYRLAHASMETVENLREAIDSRDIIGQAKGILMERHRITAEAAFDMLRVASQRSNRKLRDVAERLAFTGALPQGDGGQPLEPRPDTAL